MKLQYIIIIFGLAYFVACQEEDCGDKPEQPPWEPQDDEGIDEYIVGGRDAAGAGYWPWQLSFQFLRNETDPDSFYHTCGAVLIDPDWALTAAHCVESKMIGIPEDPRREEPDNFLLVFGAHNVSDITDEQVIAIDMIIKHERWAPDPYKGYPNDIAMLRLVQQPDLTDERVAMACVPMENDFNFTGNPDCWITGWGKVDWRDDWIPDILQEANVPIKSNEWCFDVHLGYIRDTHICAGTGYPNACSGDSGGPMSCMEDDLWYVAGITSWGLVTCNGLPGVYTRVSMYWEWIEVNKALNAKHQPSHIN